MPQVRNNVTGQVLTIADDQVPFMSSQWSVVTTPSPSAPAATPTPPAPAAPAAPQPSAPSSSTPSPAAGLSFNTPLDLYNSPTFQQAATGTLFKTQDGTYFYKTGGNGMAQVGSVAQLQDLARQGIVKPGSDVSVTLGSAQVPAPTPPAPVAPQAPTNPTNAGAAPRQAWVDDLYKKYFDRSATDAEMANWQTLSPQQLETFLQADAKKYSYTSTAMRAQQQEGIDKANQLIDADPNLTPDMKALAKQVVSSYKGGIEADAQSILKAFDAIKESTIDPHYRDLINQASYDLKASVDYLRMQRAIESQGESAQQTAELDKAIGGLEAAGLTFSGEAVKQLGAKSAYTPEVMPFGGLPEGTLNKQQRLMSTSTQARYLENLRQLGQAGESQLGTAAIQGAVPGYAPIGGVTGSIQTQKQKEYAQTLSELASNQQSKTNLNTNVPSGI